jgi:hypothetical protein
VIADGGTTVRAFATYNNTSTNPHNPNSPPRTVTLGEATTDEMMLVYFAFTAYQAGDENIIIDSSLLTNPQNPNPVKELRIFPNPVQNLLQFSHPDPHTASKMAIWDMGGRKIYEADLTHVNFISIPTQRWANGVYRIYITTPTDIFVGSALVQH